MEDERSSRRSERSGRPERSLRGAERLTPDPGVHTPDPGAHTPGSGALRTRPEHVALRKRAERYRSLVPAMLQMLPDTEHETTNQVYATGCSSLLRFTGSA